LKIIACHNQIKYSTNLAIKQAKQKIV